MTTVTIRSVLTQSPVIPVMVVESEAQAQPLAEALLQGGLTVFEITLRTPNALSIIQLLRKSYPQAIVGAGTVLNQQSLRQSIDAGAQFIVSPGLSESLAQSAAGAGVPYLPGVATFTELMAGLDVGLDTFKFFPAVQAGGVAMLKAFQSVFAGVKFCPTGGIQFENAGQFLALDNVLTVGMSSVCPPDLVAKGEFKAIEQLAKQAHRMGSKA